MIFTNKFNIPPALAARLQEDTYDHIDDPKHFSVTELISPPRMTLLMRRHFHEIERDVSERFFLWLGNLTHADINKADVNAIQEERLFLDMPGGYRISGKADQWEEKRISGVNLEYPPQPGDIIPVANVHDVSYDFAPTGLITDWKLTSVWAAIRQDKKDWETQLNAYALLYKEAGFPVTELRIYALLRDWRTGEYRRNPRDYPPIPFLDKEIPMWEEGAARRELTARLDYIKACEKHTDYDLPLCSAEERWTRDEKHAIMKEGRKTALKLFDDYESAGQFLKTLPTKDVAKCYIEHRPGIDVRCAEYCDVAQYCDYWHDSVKED